MCTVNNLRLKPEEKERRRNKTLKGFTKNTPGKVTPQSMLSSMKWRLLYNFKIEVKIFIL